MLELKTRTRKKERKKQSKQINELRKRPDLI